jgi:very-short-patch-repair endonuclease
LKGGKLRGLKFRRQHPIGTYILDFYCAAAKLAVEVDGASHSKEEGIRRDAVRTTWLNTQGVAVLRFRALSIRDELDAVLEAIASRATTG